MEAFVVGSTCTAAIDVLFEKHCEDEHDNDNEILAIGLVAESTSQVRVKRAKIRNFAEVTVQLYLEDDFKSHFRLRRRTVQVITNMLQARQPKYRTGQPGISIEKKFLASLWILANQESYRGVADRFGLSRGHLNDIVFNFIDQVMSFKNEFIKWPEKNELVQCAEDFNVLRGDKSFPGVVGCVDGSFIEISQMKEDASSYYTRKGTYAVILQGTCNSKLLFTDVFAGWPGSSNDARVWKNSPLGKKLTSEKLDPNLHLLGDSAYPLTSFLMVPYKKFGNLTNEQKEFNKRLSSTRVVIEQAFGLLKNRFRRIRFLSMTNREYIAKTIVTCCILHNICLLEDDDSVEVPDIATDDDDDVEIDDAVVNLPVAQLKRNGLAAMFSA